MHGLIFRLFRSKKKILIILVVLSGVVLFVFYERWLLYFDDFLVLQDNLNSADVIHGIAIEDYRTDFALQLHK